MDEVEEFYREWLDGIADSNRPEHTQEAALEGRLYDAFLRLPTLKAKQNVVVCVEAWAKQYADLVPDVRAQRLLW